MLSRGSGEEHWRRATSAHGQKESVLRWHCLAASSADGDGSHHH